MQEITGHLRNSQIRVFSLFLIHISNNREGETIQKEDLLNKTILWMYSHNIIKSLVLSVECRKVKVLGARIHKTAQYRYTLLIKSACKKMKEAICCRYFSFKIKKNIMVWLSTIKVKYYPHMPNRETKRKHTKHTGPDWWQNN